MRWVLGGPRTLPESPNHLLAVPLRFVWEFILQCLLRGLLLDGRRGFLLAMLLSHYAFHK
ncbi:MAG: hypothetical protein NT107_06120 [Planctomycetota bacterium]|nr:hypothetical protein [Planctomycetota bacterium]